MQNAAARLVTDDKRRDHITPVLSQLHWLPACSPSRIQDRLPRVPVLYIFIRNETKTITEPSNVQHAYISMQLLNIWCEKSNTFQRYAELHETAHPTAEHIKTSMHNCSSLYE